MVGTETHIVMFCQQQVGHVFQCVHAVLECHLKVKQTDTASEVCFWAGVLIQISQFFVQ